MSEHLESLARSIACEGGDNFVVGLTIVELAWLRARVRELKAAKE